jgi:hypothetical protein
MTQLRAEVIAHIASFRDGWIFRRRLAELVQASVRTVQRAITQARSEGVIGVARAKKTEIPPGARHKQPLPCGWSHRWLIGRDLAGKALAAAVAKAKFAAMLRRAGFDEAAAKARHGPAERARRTAAELEQRRQQAQRDLQELSDHWEREAAEQARHRSGA